ncbi:MAG: Ni/Fe hydrogenase subunit alpha [Phycisphaerae bacterium]|nr:Ni/Fe hydrogenase subunit alpha [Phycisphaerae bacterium]MCZ2401299.1 Ni/Fe hydrogenase subunit alpha [Phycisphaerae bacterium]NUQ49758.1 Ni/Fe hydrogenase subunit alpha [Phycisphaerae bacterium]
MRNVTIDVKHVTRVEGHGNIAVRVRDGEITSLQLQIVESPRFFESFMRGRPCAEAPHIACRICGICSVGHTTAAVKAVEAACGIVPSEQTVKLRKLLFYGEQIQSHVLHVLFLAVPDYLGAGSVIPLAGSHPETVKTALRLKRLANDLCAAVGGRHIHPIAAHVGGFTHVPRAGELIELKQRLVAARTDLAAVAALYAKLPIPDFERDTEYVALKVPGNGEYAFYDGDIVSTRDPRPTPVRDYRTRVIEEVVQHSAAKHCRSPNAPSYAVGALARFNNNHAQLHPAAAKLAADLGLSAPCRNPFHNNTAQLVEIVHCVECAVEMIDALLVRGMKLEALEKPTRFGQGAGAAEVPRGVLFHEYGVDSQGRIESANLIIPTGQNLANIEEDMRAYVPSMLDAGLSREEMTLRLEMLVRAYDPCISCATHLLDVEWIE